MRLPSKIYRRLMWVLSGGPDRLLAARWRRRGFPVEAMALIVGPGAAISRRLECRRICGQGEDIARLYKQTLRSESADRRLSWCRTIFAIVCMASFQAGLAMVIRGHLDGVVWLSLGVLTEGTPE